MNTTDVAIAAGVIVTGSTLIRNAHSGKNHASPIVFGFLMVSSLLLIGLVSPGFSKGLAWFSMIGALAVNGPAVFSVVGGLAGTAPKVAQGQGLVSPRLSQPGNRYLREGM